MKLSLSSLRVPPVVRSIAVGLVGLAGAAYLLRFLHRIQPLEGWFFFDLATLWFWCLVFSAACASVGMLLVRRLIPAAARSPLQSLALAFPTGVVVFMLGIYLGGFLHLLSRPFAVVFAALLIAAGLKPSLAALREARAAGLPRLPGPLGLIASLLCLLAVGIIYLGVMTPDAINYDATWVHMIIPQDYARAGHIVSFPGDQVKNVPHLGAMLVTWGFLVPGLDIPQLRWMMALHLEFTVFLWTLVGIAAGTRYLAEREVAGTWAVLLLFPGIFVYDGNMGGASDHFLAVFAVPMLLAAVHLVERFDRGVALVGGLLAGGALMTKYQAIYVLFPLLAFALIRAGLLLFKRWRGDRETPTLGAMAGAVGITAGVAFAVTLPHLVSNYVFYRNPMYPLFQNVFKHSTPTIPDAADRVNRVLADAQWQPPAALGARIWKALELIFTFSFEPHYSFVSNLPNFGFAFTIALPLLFVIERSRRLWFGALIGLGTVMMWAMSYWVDRNLQTILPVLAAASAAILLRAWQSGWFARVGVTALVVVQLAWALPLYFSGSDRISAAVDLLRGGMAGESRKKLQRYRSEYVALGESLPDNAVVLLHNQHIMLGIDRPVILDWSGFQTIIDYRNFRSARDLYDRLHELGVTHIVSVPGSFPAAAVQDEIVFTTFVGEYCDKPRTFGSLAVTPMPKQRPPQDLLSPVLTIGSNEYPDGLYAVDSLSSSMWFPLVIKGKGGSLKTSPSPDTLLDEARVVVTGARTRLDKKTEQRLNSEFHVLQSYGSTYNNLRIWRRK